MKNGLKLLLVTLPIVAIGVGILGYVVATSEPPERTALAERAVPVRVITARIEPITPRIVGFGLVSPARTFEAITQVGGTVDYINPDLQKGAILPAGAVLLRLSPVDFNLAVAQANANTRAAQARLAELKTAEGNLTSALTIELEALALKAADLARAENLFARGTVPQTSRDNVRAAHLAQRQKVQSIQSSLALQPTQRAVQIEQIAVYRASLETAELNLARAELALPFAARVATTSVEVGQFARAGQTIAVLDGIDVAEVEAQVSVAGLRNLLLTTGTEAGVLAADPARMTDVLRGLGLTAEVHLRLGQDVISWPATVDRISDTIDQKTGTLAVIVRVATAYSGAEPGKRPPLTKGMFVEVTLKAEPISGTVVPRSALRDGQVLVADAESRLRLLPVAVDLVQDGVVLIADGIAPGTNIVVSAPSPMMPGMLLETSEDIGLIDRLLLQGHGE